ncbi:hypothetical protein LY78DRAFT_654793 [Colletotrichum sublineola]|nr:hypothetical protein LY78DRAFT_654793 [Colletotrichum sublineola]
MMPSAGSSKHKSPTAAGSSLVSWDSTRFHARRPLGSASPLPAQSLPATHLISTLSAAYAKVECPDEKEHDQTNRKARSTATRTTLPAIPYPSHVPAQTLPVDPQTDNSTRF